MILIAKHVIIKCGKPGLIILLLYLENKAILLVNVISIIMKHNVIIVGELGILQKIVLLKEGYKENNSLEVDPGVLKEIMVIGKDVYEKLLFF